MKILEANGHNEMKGQLAEKQSKIREERPIVEGEKMKETMNNAVDAEIKAGVDWAKLKSTELVLEEHEDAFPNPYEWRGWHTKGDHKEWVEPLRRKGTMSQSAIAIVSNLN